ncbi:MAG TPA: Csp1 family four helix bundle copper storage protein [Kofleriaceae bacterium]|nr:Csp1 family four helix bundle copper storage protein [Kofleriaceae bacterium]
MNPQLNRRQLLGVSAGLASLAIATHATAAPKSAGSNGKVQPPTSKVPAPAPSPKAAARKALIPLISDCLVKAQACAAHCERELANGNKDMAQCARAVADMLALCGALAPLVARESNLDAKLAVVCADACAACVTACNAHAAHFAHGMHLECKACGEACSKCEAACRALAAA